MTGARQADGCTALADLAERYKQEEAAACSEGASGDMLAAVGQAAKLARQALHNIELSGKQRLDLQC